MGDQIGNLSKLRYGLKVKIFKNLLFSQAVIYLDTLYDNLLWIGTQKSLFLVDLCFTEITCYSLELQLQIRLSSGYKGEHLPKYILAKQFNIEVPILFQEFQQSLSSSSVNYSSPQKGRKPSIFNTIQNYIKTKKAACDYSSGFSRYLKKMRLQLQQQQSQNMLLFSRAQVTSALNNIDEFFGIGKQDLMEKQSLYSSLEILRILKIIYCKINLNFLKSLKGGDAIVKFKKNDNFLYQKVINVEGVSVSCFGALMRLEDKTNYMIPQYTVNQELPLTDYFCFSSHNTYLTGNQLTSDCKVTRYIEDLRKGIKCVQLDVHNKGDNEPIITHAVKGKGFCKPINFRQTIQVIDQFLQQYPNHYPVILSIQNHSTRQNQDLMYNILRKEFPKSILLPNDTSSFYTISQTKGKIIVKTSCSFENLVQFSNKDQIPKNINYPFLTNKKSSFTDSPQVNSILTNSNRQTFTNNQSQNIFLNQVDEPQTENQNYRNFLQKISKYKRLKVMFNQKIDQTSYLPVQKIVQITCLFKANKGIQTLKPRPFQCCSMQNSKIIKTQKQKITSFTKQAWIRSYPQGTQIYSSNYDFLQILARGVQIIALNTQTNDEYAIMLNSYFRAGKNSNLQKIGYIEKPQYLRAVNDKSKNFVSYPQKRNFQFTYYTNYQLQFILYSLDKSKIQINKLSQKQIKINFTIQNYNEAFLMIKIKKKWIECLPLRFLNYHKKGQVFHKNVIARDYEFEDTGIRIMTTFKWN